MVFITMKMTPETTAHTGMVTNQESSISLPTLQCTILAFSAAPTPMTLEDTTWEVDTGAPTAVEIRMDVAEEICEARLWIGLIG